MRTAGLLFGVLLILAACGPERSKSGAAKLADEAVRIAREYQESGDLNRARSALQDVDVANPLQWLVYLAETAITSSADADETRALAQLAVALGSQSQTILTYAMQTGLVEAKPAATAQAVANQEAVTTPQSAQPPALPTVAIVALEPTPAEALPSATPAETLLEPTATAAPVAGPRAVASSAVNVRGGPGTAYPIVSAMQTGETADIVGKNPQSDWWQVSLGAGQLGWVLGQLVTTAGDTGSVAVAANLPEPPPTATPAPVAPAPEVKEQPPAAAPEQPPAEAPAPAPAADGPDFVVVEKRLWDVFENGGSLSGPTVTCGEKHELIVNVLDANGGRLNNVVVQSDFNAAESFVTGAQGKGDGVVEFVLWSGQDVKIVRDADGREVTSEVARGMTTKTPDIPFEYLIAGQFCTDEASCNKFAKPPDQAPGCWGHFSWTVTFQRKY